MSDRSVSLLPDAAAVWLAGTAVVLVALLAALAYLLLRQHPNVVLDPARRVDGWLLERIPTVWRPVRRRFSRETWNGLGLTVSLTLFVLFTWLFAQVTEGWMDQEALYRIDRAVHEAFAGRLSDGTVAAFRLITHFGDVLAMLGVSLVLAAAFWRRGRRRRVAELALVMGGGQVVVWTLKFVFARQRPAAQLVEAAGHSFPSGHTFTATVLYGFLTLLLWKWTHAAGLRIFGTIVLSGLIGLVGLSRILLSVHWTSDVIGGITIGLAWLLCASLLARLLRARSAA